MGYYCTVPQCTSLAGKTKNVKFHRFPRDVIMADKWNAILKRGKPYTKYSKVCSLHFTQSDYNVTTMGQLKTLSKYAVPSQNLPKLNADGSVMVIRKSRVIKYRDSKKEDRGEKVGKWSAPVPQTQIPFTPESDMASDIQDSNLAFRLQSLNAIANSASPQSQNSPIDYEKPQKQDAIMQTDPTNSEEDDTQNSSFDTDKPFTDDAYQISDTYPKDPNTYPKGADINEKLYLKTEEDFIPQTNEEYNSEAEKYALERKSLNGYDKLDLYPKTVAIEYQKSDTFAYPEKYPNRTDLDWYPNEYMDSVEMLKNQQLNLDSLQNSHRLNERHSFLHENRIKQEIDANNEENKFLFGSPKEQEDANSLMRHYEQQRRINQQKLMEQIQQQVKQEPEGVSDPQSGNSGSDNVIQPQGSPYYANTNESVGVSSYYEQITRPGPELLMAKQNALAAHTQLWQNTMKRPFFYSESAHFNNPPLLHRYEDISRILQ